MAAGAPFAQNIEPRHLRKSEIQNNGIIRLFRSHDVAVGAVVGSFDGKSRRIQPFCEAFGYFRVILDEENANGALLWRSLSRG